VTGYRCRVGRVGGHRVGLKGRELGARKLALGIETYKDETGRTTRWYCRRV
jgi:hypothetical protein